MYYMLQKYTLWSVAGVFFKEPTKEHYLKQISREIQIAHTSVKKNLDRLMRLSIIKEKVIEKGKRKFPVYKANINSKQYLNYKRLYNLIIIKESGLIDYLYDKIMPNSIVLFGSFQKGEDTEKSDIDIYIESQPKKMDLSLFEKKLNRKIQLHFKINFRSYPKELKNSIINGTVLRGYLEGY